MDQMDVGFARRDFWNLDDQHELRKTKWTSLDPPPPVPIINKVRPFFVFVVRRSRVCSADLRRDV